MIKRLICVQAILTLWAAAQTPAANRKYSYGTPDALKWVDPDHSDLGDLRFKTFHSATVGRRLFRRQASIWQQLLAIATRTDKARTIIGG